MTTPVSFREPAPLDARLVTKTSLPNPKRAIALLIVLWIASGKPDCLEYGIASGEKAAGGVFDEIDADLVERYLTEHGVQYSSAAIRSSLKDNELFRSHMESLNSAFELVWHLASFSFVDSTLNRASERKGGLRYRKRIKFSTNLDLVDLIVSHDPDAFARVFSDWISDRAISHDEDAQQQLIRMLAVFEESSLFKTSKGETGTVFVPSGIYDALLSSNSVVKIVDQDEEPQGTTRILKSAIGTGLNPMLCTDKDDKNGVVRADGVDDEELRYYSNRAKLGIDLSNVKVNITETGNDEDTGVSIEEIAAPRNLIYFGAPGTGKSYQLDKKANEVFPKENILRVTFHPDYTYAQFFGCYKPTMVYPDDPEMSLKEQMAHGQISYSFVPGPFLRTYIQAVQNPKNPYLLIVEEINRANPAAVFGDVFQLLDRNDAGRSEYEITLPREVEEFFAVRLDEFLGNGTITDPQYLLSEQLRLTKEKGRLSLPPNMFIWATMNSADQGVFPMDTAFKRRWNFKYMGINDGETDAPDIVISNGKNGEPISWHALRRGINKLLQASRVNEDKFIGPFFMKAADVVDPATFSVAFESKVLLYLYEDAAKTKRDKLFKDAGKNTFSTLCSGFSENGTDIFNGFGIPVSSPDSTPEPASDSEEEA